MKNTKLSYRFPLGAGLLLALAATLPAQETLRWDEQEILANVVHRSEPAYPAMARQARVAGQVKLELSIDSSGKVEKSQAVSGNPLLVGAAMSAVRTWKFKPPTIDGKPAKATAVIVFTFKL